MFSAASLSLYRLQLSAFGDVVLCAVPLGSGGRSVPRPDDGLEVYEAEIIKTMVSTMDLKCYESEIIKTMVSTMDLKCMKLKLLKQWSRRWT